MQRCKRKFTLHNVSGDRVGLLVSHASQMRWLFVGEALVLRKEQRVLEFLVFSYLGCAFLKTLNSELQGSVATELSVRV